MLLVVGWWLLVCVCVLCVHREIAMTFALWILGNFTGISISMFADAVMSVRLVAATTRRPGSKEGKTHNDRTPRRTVWWRPHNVWRRCTPMPSPRFYSRTLIAARRVSADAATLLSNLRQPLRAYPYKTAGRLGYARSVRRLFSRKGADCHTHTHTHVTSAHAESKDRRLK